MTAVKVFGIGGAGNNTLSRMKIERFSGVELIGVNTDVQALERCLADRKVRIGEKLTHGTGAGNDPDLGMRSAEDSWDDIKGYVTGSDLVFVIAGQGGGTGTGATPVIAGMAKEMGALVVGVVTSPFFFEGSRKLKQADEGIRLLHESVDALIVIPNDRLLEVKEDVPVVEAFQMSDEVVLKGIRAITRLVLEPGLIKVDFADVRYVLEDSGLARIGTGTARGYDSARRAAVEAAESPLLESSVDDATRVLINVYGNDDISLFDVNEAVEVIAKSVDPQANMVFGAVSGESNEDNVTVTMVAAGFKGRERRAGMNVEQVERRLRQKGVDPDKQFIDSPTMVRPQ
ncbi:MAG: cell division protein FtsZ [Actinobacteria bacterium]|nr:cell division protein FtsZ [Actinomycetota bacterium]